MHPCILTAATVALLALSTTAQARPFFDANNVEHLVALSSPGFEAKPDISADKLTLLFASAQSPGAGSLDLWETTRPTPTSPFGPQRNLTELNTGGRDHTPTTTADGLLMIYSSERAGGLGIDDAWMTTRPDTNAPWGPPVNIPELSTPGRDMGFTMTPDGLRIYFTSNFTLLGDFDIFASSRPDRSSPWAPPVPVAELNTPWDDKFPSVTGDDRTMYFASNRPGGVIDPNFGVPSLDLWVAMRPDPSASWGTVIENVFEVNTQYGEYLMSIADDGSELFFVSDRPGALGLFDLYRVPALRGVERYGVGVAGEVGVPRLRPVGGPAREGNPSWGYETTNVSSTAAGFFVFSFAPSTSPLAVDLSLATPVLFQAPVFVNPPPATPRILNSPIPVGLAGFTSYWQVVMLWDLRGAERLFGVSYAASPGLKVTFFR